MVYFKAKGSDVVFKLNKRTGHVTWDGCVQGSYYDHFEWVDYFKDGTWAKCTKKGFPLEGRK